MLCITLPLNNNNNKEDSVGTCVPVTTPSTIDFTPAEYITLLFTDIGVLTPAAISDELIRMMM